MATPSIRFIGGEVRDFLFENCHKKTFSNTDSSLGGLEKVVGETDFTSWKMQKAWVKVMVRANWRIRNPRIALF